MNTPPTARRGTPAQWRPSHDPAPDYRPVQPRLRHVAGPGAAEGTRMSTITDTLNEIKARAEVATPGPWLVDDLAIPGEVSVCDQECVIVHTSTNENSADPVAQRLDQLTNATFIAHSREDILRLVAAVRRGVSALRCKEGCASELATDSMLCPNCAAVADITAILTTQPEDHSS